MLKLEFPNETHREMYKKIQEKKVDFLFHRALRKFEYQDYDELLRACREDVNGRIGLVPSTFFFLIKDNEIIGSINIRHHIHHPNLKDVGGHIGYGIVPWERRKGYGTQQLSLALQEAKKLELGKIMISCLRENIASSKIILANGGILETERILDNPPEDMKEDVGKTLQIYWITL